MIYKLQEEIQISSSMARTPKVLYTILIKTF
jgi:hypothetical protein